MKQLRKRFDLVALRPKLINREDRSRRELVLRSLPKCRSSAT